MSEPHAFAADTLQQIILRDLQYIMEVLRQLDAARNKHQSLPHTLMTVLVQSASGPAERVRLLCVELSRLSAAPNPEKPAPLPESIQAAVLATLAERKKIRQFVVQRLANGSVGPSAPPTARRAAFAEATGRCNYIGQQLDLALHARHLAAETKC